MRIWFITGASRGFGRQWAEAALERGDAVAATARDVAALQPLADTYGDAVLPIRLDVTDRAAGFAAVAACAERFGGLDVVVNNAGYGHFGMAEELTEDDLRAQLEANFFGAVWISQAALPIMRARGGGHILQVSSLGGVTAFPGLSAYHASKWALEGFTQALAGEVAGFGIRVTLVEPGAYTTDWIGASARHSESDPAYADLRESISRGWADRPGDPAATRAAIRAIVDADEPPLRVLLGRAPLATVTRDYETRLAEWNAWQPVAVAAYGP
jgi:NAD(P)-dependent dehydrogenase (short-subunit alcohol dehydrogenase family)